MRKLILVVICFALVAECAFVHFQFWIAFAQLDNGFCFGVETSGLFYRLERNRSIPDTFWCVQVSWPVNHPVAVASGFKQKYWAVTGDAGAGRPKAVDSGMIITVFWENRQVVGGARSKCVSW